MSTRRTMRHVLARVICVAGGFVGLAGTSSAVITGSLSTQFDDIVTGGGVVAQGVGMAGREDGQGNAFGGITITGIPPGATVQRALLYWTVSNGAQAYASLNNNLVTGTLRATINGTCWAGHTNNTYRADVTSVVTGNGTYGAHNLPSSPMLSDADTNGAALVVVYADKTSANVRRIMIRDGGIYSSGSSETVSDTFTGVAAPMGTVGKFHLAVSDGQESAIDGALAFNGVTLGTNQFTGSDGSMIDVKTYDVAVPANTPNLTWTSNNLGDCHSYEAAVLDFGLPPSADVAITVTGGASAAVPGAQVIYTIVVTNNGPSAVTDAAVVDHFPEQCNSMSTTSVASGGAAGNSAGPFAGNINQLLSMPSGSSVTYTSTCTIAMNAMGTLVNHASAGSLTTPDPNPGNNNASNTALLSTVLDVDGNGLVDALTDGLMILRYMFGLTGQSLISNAVAPGAPRNTAIAIEAYLQSLMP